MTDAERSERARQIADRETAAYRAELDRRVQIEASFSILADDGDMEAFAKVARRPTGILWVLSLWVQKDKRGLGYASALLRAVLRECGHETLYLEVAPYTDRPMGTDLLTAFYQRFGFRKTVVPGIMMRPGDRAE